MKTNKAHRFVYNPKEKELHDNFIKIFESDKVALSTIIFGWENNTQQRPKEYLTEREKDICLNIIQWLGSPVGICFLSECGFLLINKKP